MAEGGSVTLRSDLELVEQTPLKDDGLEVRHASSVNQIGLTHATVAQSAGRRDSGVPSSHVYDSSTRDESEHRAYELNDSEEHRAYNADSFPLANRAQAEQTGGYIESGKVDARQSGGSSGIESVNIRQMDNSHREGETSARQVMYLDSPYGI